MFENNHPTSPPIVCEHLHRYNHDSYTAVGTLLHHFFFFFRFDIHRIFRAIFYVHFRLQIIRLENSQLHLVLILSFFPLETESILFDVVRDSLVT